MCENNSNRRPAFQKQCTATFGEEEKFEEKVIDTLSSPKEDTKPVFLFHQYSKNAIIRPMPVVAASGALLEEENSRMEELLEDPVVKYYASLPMAGYKPESCSEDN